MIRAINELREFLAEQRARARAQMLAEGWPPEQVDQVMRLAEEMHAQSIAESERRLVEVVAAALERDQALVSGSHSIH